MAKFVLDKTENVVGKEEKVGYQHFLLLPQCFQKPFSLGLQSQDSIKHKCCAISNRSRPIHESDNHILANLLGGMGCRTPTASFQIRHNMFSGFLTPVLIQLFFAMPRTTFLTCFCRGERRKYADDTRVMTIP